MMKILKKLILASVLLFLLSFIALSLYSLDAYQADEIALKVYETQRVEILDQQHIFESTSQTGIIFYPGGKVEIEAYAYLASLLQDAGIHVYLVDMPFNLAVFNIDAAQRIVDENSHIQNWVLMGHSLGGAMASSHLKNHADLYEGIIYLAAYPLNTVDIPQLILVGENDEVLDRDKLLGFEYYLIEGGNHAFYGNYGEQAGDGLASITREQQQAITVTQILNFIK